MTLAAITMTAPEAASPVQMYRATYSPDDNKLRLYAVSRLDPETYKKVHDAGFRWAPKQALFVAPAWTPGREDVLLSLAGEIEDEDSTLAERQEARAERFTGSSVTTPNYSFLGYSGTMKVTPDRITDYKAPSAEEAAVASQAAKRPPVVNYPGEGFREMTKAQWAALPRDCKAVRSVAEAEDHGAYRYRRTMDNNFRLVNVYISDMKITEIPQK